MGKCHFQDEWLERRDNKGNLISSWAKKDNETTLRCLLCQKNVNISNGFYAVQQHWETKKHSSLAVLKLGARQLRLTNVVPAPEAGAENVPGTIRLYSVKDAADTAELIWAMKNVNCNMSAESCRGIANTFSAMFPSGVPEHFSLSPTKLSYLITDALAPYFSKLVSSDLKGAHYTLIYDETTNAAGKKELQTAVRYWSKERGEVVFNHLESFYMGHATGLDLKNNLLKAVDNKDLPLKDLIMLGSDGPNVNKTVFRLVNEAVKEVRGTSLLNIGTCNIHIVHNAFQKGLGELGKDVADALIMIYHFFDGYPSRWEDYECIQKQTNTPSHKLIKHVPSRWLTLEPAAARLYEQWDALYEYFLKFIPKKNKAIMTAGSYKNIAEFLGNKSTKAEILFVMASAKIFTNFTGTFQREEPLIHMLFDELKTLIFKIMGRVCKKEAIEHLEDFSKAFNDLLLAKDITFDNEGLKREFLLLSDVEKSLFKIKAQKHYVAAGNHIIKKSSLDTNAKLLRAFQCLHPKRRKTKTSWKHITCIAKELAIVVDADVLLDEWKLLQLEKDLENAELLRIDHYWNSLLKKTNIGGDLKFPTVGVVVRAALTLSHGSADIERGFSRSARVMTEDKAAMSERTLNARIMVGEVLRTRYGNKPESVPITKELLAMAHVAHKEHENYLQRQKALAEEKEKLDSDRAARIALEKEQAENVKRKSKDLADIEKDLKKAKIAHKEKKAVGDQLFLEANDRLKAALKTKNISEMKLAQAMIDGVKNVREQEEKEKKAVDILQSRAEKKKSSIIDLLSAKRATH